MPGRAGAGLTPMQVFMWPETTPRWQNGVLLIGVRHVPGLNRDTARMRVRQALSEALAQVLDVPLSCITFAMEPGQAPRIGVPGHEHAGLSISHDGEFSVAAVHLHGAVGIDVMTVLDTFDWHGVAGDYLGPQVLARLCAVDQLQRARLFTRAWCEREARLKCAGLTLGEWSREAQRPYRIVELDLPAGLLGVLALPV